MLLQVINTFNILIRSNLLEYLLIQPSREYGLSMLFVFLYFFKIALSILRILLDFFYQPFGLNVE